VPATVVATTFLGRDATVELAVAGIDRTVTARVGPGALPEPGDEVELRVDGELPAFPAASTGHDSEGEGDGDGPPATDDAAGGGDGSPAAAGQPGSQAGSADATTSARPAGRI
jgi:hypothetical protein